MQKILSELLAIGLLLAGEAARGEALVENVRARQRERSRVVDVWYDLVSEDGGVFEVSLWIAGGGDEPPLSTVGGDIGEDIESGRNKHIEWNAGADWPGHLQENFVAAVTATRMAEEDTGPSAGMVRIPGGTNSGNDPDFGSYSLTVESFYMDKTEVTYAHWKRVYNWAVAHGYRFSNEGGGKAANHPVHTVNWDDCMKWCNARSEMEGRMPAYTMGNGNVYRSTLESDPNVDLDGEGYRLPTAEEWEYASRGGKKGRRFPWGDTISHAKANYYADSSCELYDTSIGEQRHPRFNDGVAPFTAPVGSFSANAYGLYDMAGNLSEWVYAASGSPRYRGGGWNAGASYCRCRDVGISGWDGAYGAYTSVGFRTVRSR